jgi:tryptophanyl-tRNA synthetase
MRNQYLAGGYGYGHAKQALFELIVEKFKVQRETYRALMDETVVLDMVLRDGADKAQEVAEKVLGRVRRSLGLVVRD